MNQSRRSPNPPASSRLLLDVHERPEPLEWIILAIQHVFAMFGATILVPILVNAAAGETVLTIPVALVTSGIGTLIYIVCTKGRSPVYIGSSFAFIAPLAAAYLQGGIAGAMTGMMVVGAIYVVTAIIVHFIGKGWIDTLLPPVVVGPMIMIIGLGLAPSAVTQIGLDTMTLEWTGILIILGIALVAALLVLGLRLVLQQIDSYGVRLAMTIGVIALVIVAATLFGHNFFESMSVELRGLISALVTFLTIALLAVAGRGFFKIIPVLLGIVVGYVVAAVLGLVDFAPVIEAAFFSMPAFMVPFVSYQPNFSAALTMAPIAIVTMSEHIGDHTALGKIIGKDLLHDPGLDRTLAGDGIATFVAALLGGPANTTYGENTAVVGLTKVASVWVIGLAAIIAVCLGFLGKFTALVSTIPNPVLGGASIVLYGFIATNGLKVLIEHQVDFSKLRNVIVALSMLVLGLGGASIPLTIGSVTITFSGMSLAAIAGVLLNLLLPAETEVGE